MSDSAQTKEGKKNTNLFVKILLTAIIKYDFIKRKKFNRKRFTKTKKTKLTHYGYWQSVTKRSFLFQFSFKDKTTKRKPIYFGPNQEIALKYKN